MVRGNNLTPDFTYTNFDGLFLFRDIRYIRF